MLLTTDGHGFTRMGVETRISPIATNLTQEFVMFRVSRVFIIRIHQCASVVESLTRAEGSPSGSGKSRERLRRAAFGLRLNTDPPVGWVRELNPLCFASLVMDQVRFIAASEPANAQDQSDERSNGCWRWFKVPGKK